MGERLSTVFSIVLLVLLAALSYWLDRVVQAISPAPEGPAVHEADYSAEKLLATRMNLEGHIRDTLYAVTLTHYADDDSTELIRPRFVNFGGRAPLTITAAAGKVTSNAEDIYFSGDVVVTRASVGDGHGPLTVTTDYLHVLPDDNIVQTNRPVVIRDNLLTVHAGGMDLNSENRILKLNGGVRGAYNASDTGNR